MRHRKDANSAIIGYVSSWTEKSLRSFSKQRRIRKLHNNDKRKRLGVSYVVCISFFVALLTLTYSTVRGYAMYNRMDLDNASPTAGSSCTCVECTEDVECGGLWKGDAIGGDPHSFETITIVVSHCLHSLEWLANFTQGFSVSNVTIVSKCGQPVLGLPSGSTIVRLPNKGRCDQSFAHWLTKRAASIPSKDEEKEAVLFLKDDRTDASIHQPGVWRSMHDMLRIASGSAGFACGMLPTEVQLSPSRSVFLSAYHEVEKLVQFNLQSYESKNGKYNHLKPEAVVPFVSQYKNLGGWAQSLGLEFEKGLVNVCYGGTFAVSASQIRKSNSGVWRSISKSLMRGDNIQEGHFAERMWASLLSQPLKDYQIAALRQYAEGERSTSSVTPGSLVRYRNRGFYATLKNIFGF